MFPFCCLERESRIVKWKTLVQHTFHYHTNNDNFRQKLIFKWDKFCKIGMCQQGMTDKMMDKHTMRGKETSTFVF